MNWFFLAIWVVLTFKEPLIALVLAVAYLIYWFAKNASEPSSQKSEIQKPNLASELSDISAGDLADLILLRLELQRLPDLNPEQQTELNQRVDQLCLDYLASLNAVYGNSLWRKHRDDAWDLLNRHADKPLGLPPWLIEIVKETKPVIKESPTATFTVDLSSETKADFSKPVEIDIPITPVIKESPIATFTADLSSEIKPDFSKPVEIDIPITPIIKESPTAAFTADLSSETKPDFSKPVEIDIPITPVIKESPTAAFTADLSSEIKPDFSKPVEIDIPITPVIKESPTAAFTADLSSETKPSEQAAVFAIDESEHSATRAYQADSPKPSKPDSTLNQYAWKPHEPSALERTLSTLSNWHSLAKPFLVQNIGWFIGVFCFIAGSAFLVHSTEGYTSNLITFFSLFIFTITLLFGGYQLRRQRPDLEISSYVIFILSLLLIPLTTITATQLLITGDGFGLKMLGGGLVVVELGVFYVVVTLVSGLMDRSLQQGLPKFFLALTATQLLQVLLLALPFWWLLMAVHLLVFALLSTSIYLFVNQWLQSIFIDRYKIAYFAAGTLIYAAIVSFVFITTGNAIALPDGYYGFFLLLLCGLLFFIDAQLKQWAEQHTYLSRFSFLVYGLSVLALLLVAKYPIAIPSLVLAIGLYGFIVWRYLTLTPLTILLVCYFWLYDKLVLQYLTADWYLLASLPVLFSLYKAAQWAVTKRQSVYLAVIVYRVLYGLLVLLTVLSLSQSTAGFTGMMTAITAGILVYYTLKSAPIAIFKPYSKIDPVSINSHQNLLGSHWFYSIPVLAMVTVFYTPRLPLLTSEVQFSLGMLFLAVFWGYYGLSSFFKARNSSATTPIEQRLNSAVFSVIVAIVPMWILSDNIQRAMPLFLAGIFVLWLSYQLLARSLFYVALLVLVTAYLPIKPIKDLYFPTPSGLATVLISIGLWFWLWYRERQSTSELVVLKREQVGQKLALLPPCKLIGWYPLPRATALFREVIAAPLEQLMCLLWFFGMKTLYSRFFDNPSYAWLAAVFLIALFTALLIIRYSLLKLLPIPIALTLTAVLLTLRFFGLTTDGFLLITVIFALLSWQIVNYSLSRAGFIRLINELNPKLDDIQQAGYISHHTAFFMVMVGVVSQLLNAGTHSVTVLLTLITTVGFLWLSDRRYKQLIVRYLVLGFGVLAGFELVFIIQPAFNITLLFVLLSLAVGALSIPATIYGKPSANTAIFLVFIAICLQLHHIVQITAIITPLDYSVLLLAGFSLLLANAKYKSAFYAFTAFTLWVLAILWIENSLVHAQQPFSLWLNTVFADLWLLLAFISLAITVLSQWLKVSQKVDADYLPPLNTVAMLCFVWALLGSLMLFFSSAGHASFLALIFLVLLLALFPLSKNHSGAAQIRGIFSANLLSLAAFNVLPVGLEGFALQSVTVLFAYTLWLFASFVLPQFNKRYSEWTIEPIFFPYLGFLLAALSVCWWRSFSDFNIGLYCLELCIYCLLMLRYSRWTGFAWLASFTVVGAVLWLENSFIHPDQTLSLLLDTHTPIDSWLLLGLLSLSLSMLSHKLKPRQAWADVYCLPLGSVAILCFVWGLFGSSFLFLMTAGHANGLAVSWLILLLAVFSLAKGSSNAAHIRGFASANLLSLAAFNVLPVGLEGFALQSVTVAFAYTLWLFASFVLPQFNKRYTEWTVEPIFFPYLGFLLVALSACWWRSFNDFNIGVYCLELCIYCLLMLRYSRWTGFAWLASFTVVGAVLWLENSFIHPDQALSLLLDAHTPIDSWLLLGLLSLSLSMLSNRLKSWQAWANVFCLPLGSVAVLCFIWALFGLSSLFLMTAGHADGLAISWLILLMAVFSLAKDSSNAAHTRGFASACLPTLAAFSLLPVGLDSFALQSIVVVFGYTLWLFATLILPRFNQRYSEWTIQPDYFPWLGLLLVVFSHGLWHTLIAADVGIYCLELLGYSLLMFRYSSWAGFAWLAAFTFTAAGIAFNFDEDSLPVNLLLWSNVQLLLGTLWQRKGKKIAEQWQWHTPPLADAFAYTTRFIFIGYLLIASITLVLALLDGIDAMDKTLLPVISIGILLALSFLHLLWLRFSSVALHGFIHSLFLLIWSVYFTQFNHLFQPALLLALWSLLLLAMGQIRITAHTDDIAHALRYWLHTSVILATLALLTYTEHTLGELILSLAIVAGLSTVLGGKNTNSPWLWMARLEALLLLHGWVFLLLGHTLQTFALLLPWYALQNTLLGVLSMWFLNRLLEKPMSSENQAYYEQVLSGTSWLMVLGLLQLLGHGLFIQHAVMAGQQAQWLFSPLDSIAAFITGAIIVTVSVRHVRHLPDSGWLYGIIALIGALGFYGRLLWLGSASVSLWDTSLLIGSAYLLFFLQRIFPSKPLLNMALLMPVLAIFTVPLQLASPETSITLIVTGLLYAMMRRYNQQKIPLYMAMLAFNASVYLWVPNLVDSSRLIQVYVIPAALSCLLLLQMHSRELKPSVLMGSRLAAISSIYACATVDVFLRAEAEQLGVFILAMALSVAGIVLGIALRTRAFLYAGVSFLLLNVLGQLRLPDQGMGKAIVLMVMGATIMVFMIWFNIKRAEILQRIGTIKAEMQTWE